MLYGDLFDMCFTTELYGQEATHALAEFAPHEIRGTLEAQTPRLNEILKTGRMPHLGTNNGYLWLLAVWSIPAPTRVCLMATRVDYERMTIAEALQIEEEAINRASQAARRLVGSIPHAVNYELTERMWNNIRRNNHWSFGL